VVCAASATARVSIRYLRHENHGPGYTQNRGIRAADGSLVLLLADDIFLTPTALSAHLKRHREQPDPKIAVLGQTIRSPEMKGSRFQRTWGGFGLDRFDHLKELPPYLFWAFNLSFKRDFILANGAFNELPGRGGPPAHEDTELGCRLHHQGMILLYAKEALGYHYHPTTLRLAARRYYERGLNYHDLVRRVSDPKLTVFFRVLDWRTLGSYRRALRDSPWLGGRERYLLWHIFRHSARWIFFNRLTVPAFWRPLLERCQVDGLLSRITPPYVYAPFLFYHFLAGIRDGTSH
jgi:GT2 family glycosyltransferase